MKILMVIEVLICGGAQRMFTYIANSLSDNGYTVSIVSYASRENYFPLNQEINYVKGNEFRGGRFTRHLLKIPFVRSVIKEIQPDIVIAFAPIPAIISILARGFNRNIAVIFCERGDPYQRNTIFDKITVFLCQKADWFVFQTENAKRYYNNRVQNNSTIIPNPVTLHKNTIVPYEKRKNEIAFVGRFEVRQKRQDLMIKAFAIINKDFPSVNLVFYGDGEDLDMIKELVQEYHLDKNVIFAGTVVDVQELIKDSKVFVLASDFEGIPNALIEAMNLGLPCVSTDCSPGGARLLIENMQNGILVPVDDYKSLAAAVCFILSNPIKGQAMGVEAQKITEKFASDKIIRMWTDMIENVYINRKR